MVLVIAVENVIPNTSDCLDNDSFNLFPYIMSRYSSFLKIIPKSQNAPLVTLALFRFCIVEKIFIILQEGLEINSLQICNEILFNITLLMA